MTSQPTAALEPSALKDRLAALHSERSLAFLTGLDRNRAYMDDLAGELRATEAAYTGLAVTEIASLRAALDGPLVG